MSNNTVVRVSCSDQVLKILEAPVIASGGVNEVRVEFEFCSKWDGLAKVALFYQDETEPYYALVGEDDSCIVPWEVCLSEGTFFFSVFGDKDGIRRTSATLRYKVKKGAITESLSLAEPTPEIYDQILAALAAMRAENRELAADIADLKYVPVKISDFTVSPRFAEYGSTVNKITLKWSLNKDVVSQELRINEEGAEILDAAVRSKTYEGQTLTEKVTYTLEVKDEKNSIQKEAALEFVKPVYFGAMDADMEIDREAVMGMIRSLEPSRNITFAVNVKENQRLTFIQPSSYSDPVFIIDNLYYSWNPVKVLEDFANESGYVESYTVWQEPNSIPGSPLIKVT